MTAETMLTRLQANYQVLEAQFHKTDLSAIPPAKLVELMLRHVTAMQRAMQLLAKPAAPPPAPKDKPTNSAPTPKAAKASEPAPAAKPVPAKPTPVSPALAQAEKLLDRLQERNDHESAELLRRLGLQPPPKEPPYNPIRYKATVPPRPPAG